MNILTEVEEIKKIFSVEFITFFSKTFCELYKKYKIDKNIDFSNKKILSSPLILEESENSRQFIGDDMVTYGITRFISTVSNKLSKDNLKILNHNLKSITIHNHSKILLINIYNLIKNKTTTSGTYMPILNSIYTNSSFENKILYGPDYDERDMYNVLFHELFHMSSTVYDANRYTIFSGFKQVNYEGPIGEAINEGYTERLTNRFFGSEYGSYLYEVIIIGFIEEIVGVKNLEKFYFNADLEYLVKELSKYSNEKDTIQFILDLDNNLKNNNENKIDKEIVKNINKYIIKINEQKNKQYLETGIINETEYLKRMDNLSIALQECDELLNKIVKPIDAKEEKTK